MEGFRWTASNLKYATTVPASSSRNIFVFTIISLRRLPLISTIRNDLKNWSCVGFSGFNYDNHKKNSVPLKIGNCDLATPVHLMRVIDYKFHTLKSRIRHGERGGSCLIRLDFIFTVCKFVGETIINSVKF